jgi:hypothetical protein
MASWDQVVALASTSAAAIVRADKGRMRRIVK